MGHRLREAERRYAIEGTTEAETALLRAQTRSQTDPDRCLRIVASASLGYAPACVALAGPAPDSDEWLEHWWTGEGRVPRWSMVLDQVGPAAQIRVGIAITSAHLPYGFAGVRRAARFLLEDEERVVAAGDRRDALNFEHTGIDKLLSILRPSSVVDPELVRSCDWRHGHSWLPAAELRRAIHDDLVPWLLGRGDPVAERVAARPEPTPPVTVVRYV